MGRRKLRGQRQAQGLKEDKSTPTIAQPKNPPTVKRSASQLGLTRTNSLDDVGKGLKPAKRNRADSEDTSLTVEEMKEFSVIGVFSREASKNFAKAYEKLMRSDDPGERITKLSKTGKKTNIITERDALQSRTKVSTGFEDQVQALFKNKTTPHVIAVIEGQEEQSTLKFKTEIAVPEEKGAQSSLTSKKEIKYKSVDLGYTKTKFMQGLNSNSGKDSKQNMSFYVRDDMKNVYSVSEEAVPRGTKKINCGAIDFKTEGGKRYRVLVVHIPNEFIKTQSAVETTHKAFLKYAEDAAKNDVFVTGYLGDTNFKKPYSENSAPSVGGIMPDGSTFNPRSSGASTDTNFMQSIPLGKGKGQYTVLQPSTANYVFLDTNDAHKEATDHPSIIATTALNKRLLGRDPDALPAYYPMVE